ncbi:MAG: SGNH/GDSL hydrolase family protein [Actinobacteria bacterium]|uniref:Unannotated protein n=1 Tax=freshwater metagenome TaxID=449393 RepID=A0A6J7JR60_9ZZZZ|nr:SGNH/GDSL hydrolase family protein [Actinomycetota bacterium]
MRPLRVVGLGDSVTAGVGDVVGGGNSPGWAAHLAVLLGASEYLCLARTGARMRDVVAEQLPEATAFKPDLATLLIGGNDVLRSDFDAVRVARGARDVCVELTAAGGVVLVVLLHDPSMVLPRGGLAVGRVLAARAAALNVALLADLAGMPGVVVLDPRDFEVAHLRSTWHIDRMHPSAQGHRALATMAATWLSRRGFHPVAPVPPVPEQCPGPVLVAVWLVAHGVPWLLRRSVDLIPELVGVVIAERRAERARTTCQGGCQSPAAMAAPSDAAAATTASA